ncbi:MAG: type II toxin-antitoxin system HicA family toxin [Clostridiales bacterium]|jgi:predicted RNA binding protein YcfA (HicA-like mRNA interferase family)|nr:type II toxin-antitoxin system HicA family toxin [Clostridiales bacterium]
MKVVRYKVTGKQIVKLLKTDGWVVSRIEGSHHIMKKSGFPPITVPVHGTKELKPGVENLILKVSKLKRG